MKLTQRQRKWDPRHESRDQLDPTVQLPTTALSRNPSEPNPLRQTPASPSVQARLPGNHPARRQGDALIDNVPMIASALAYSAFLAIPSTLLVATGLFTLVAGPDTISNLMQHLGQIAPKETVTLLNDSLQRLNDHPATSVVMTIVGFVIALWATTGAMNAFMTGLNIAYDRKDGRNVRDEAARRAADDRLHGRCLSARLWSTRAWARVLEVGRERDRGNRGRERDLVGGAMADPARRVAGSLRDAALPRPGRRSAAMAVHNTGALVAVVAWLAASGLFAVYTSMFGSYNKTWGSLAAVIIMLTWLWLTGSPCSSEPS